MPKNYDPYDSYEPHQANRLLRAGLVGALLLGAFAAGYFLLSAFDGTDTTLAKSAGDPQVLGTSVTRDGPLIPPNITVPPTTELVPINTLPPSLATTIPETTAPATTSPGSTAPATPSTDGPSDPWREALTATIAEHPVLDGRSEDELRAFVDSVCAAKAAGATDQFISDDLAQQAIDKGWTAELAAAVQALREAGTAAVCP